MFHYFDQFSDLNQNFANFRPYFVEATFLFTRLCLKIFQMLRFLLFSRMKKRVFIEKQIIFLHVRWHMHSNMSFTLHYIGAKCVSEIPHPGWDEAAERSSTPRAANS